MSFTIDDFQDLVRLLGEHPEWRVELRRQVLSDELLELPALMRELAEAQGRTEPRVTQLAEAQGRTEQRVTQLAEAQARTEQRVAELVEVQSRAEERLHRIESAIERLEAIIERLAEAQGSNETRVGRIEGEVLEARYARRGPSYLSRLARRLRLLETGLLADLLDAAVQEDRLTDAERDAVLLADVVFSGRRREDDADVYVLADISAGIGPHDVERAAERAGLLEKLGRPVIPVVAGWRIDAEALEMASQRGVWHALDGRVAPPSGS